MTHPYDTSRTPDEADETQTQWVPAGPPPAAPAPAAAESGSSESEASEPGQVADEPGWFAAEPVEPVEPVETEGSAVDAPQGGWADWDEPWSPPPIDEPAATSAADQPPEPAPEATPAPPAPPAAPEFEPAPERSPSSTQAAATAVRVPPWPGYEEPTRVTTTDPAPEAAAAPAAPAQSPQPDQPASSDHGHRATSNDRRSDASGWSASLANLQLIRVIAQVACPLLLLVGLTFAEDGAQSGWEAYTAWAVFAAACAALQLAPLVRRSLTMTAENAWFLAAVGTAGLVGYWVIIVLPGVSSDTGFAQTLAAGAAVIGLWLSPGRRS